VTRTTAPPADRSRGAARAILDPAPAVMRAIRTQMRAGRPSGVSVPHFRALFYIRRQPGIDLSDGAEHLGTSLASASELVARLVRQGLVQRSVDPASRRRMRLALTPSGAGQLDAAEAATLAWLARRLDGADPARLEAIEAALADLGDLLLDRSAGEADGRDRGTASG
jgi:DNA-binding MarR family transcriptional regulator